MFMPFQPSAESDTAAAAAAGAGATSGSGISHADKVLYMYVLTIERSLTLFDVDR